MCPCWWKKSHHQMRTNRLGPRQFVRYFRDNAVNSVHCFSNVSPNLRWNQIRKVAPYFPRCGMVFQCYLQPNLVKLHCISDRNGTWRGCMQTSMEQYRNVVLGLKIFQLMFGLDKQLGMNNGFGSKQKNTPLWRLKVLSEGLLLQPLHLKRMGRCSWTFER